MVAPSISYTAIYHPERVSSSFTGRERPEELTDAVSLTPWAREEFIRSDFQKDEILENDVERTRQFLSRIWM